MEAMPCLYKGVLGYYDEPVMRMMEYRYQCAESSVTRSISKMDSGSDYLRRKEMEGRRLFKQISLERLCLLPWRDTHSNMLSMLASTTKRQTNIGKQAAYNLTTQRNLC